MNYFAHQDGRLLASNFNARPRPLEVLVMGDKHRVVRRRETYEDIGQGEAAPQGLSGADPGSRG